MTTWKSACTLCVHLLVGMGVFAQTSESPGPVRDLPQAAGVYCRQGQRGWVKLDRARMGDSKTHGMGRFVDTDGLSGLDVTVFYQGAQAALQLTDRRPTFYVRGTIPYKEALQDAIVVELAPRKSSREVQTSSTIAGIGNREGYRRGEIRRVIVTELTKDSFTVRPQQDLKAGEYLLVLSHADEAFDFGIKPANK